MEFEDSSTTKSSMVTKVVIGAAVFMILAAVVIGAIFVLRSRSQGTVQQPYVPQEGDTTVIPDGDTSIIPQDDDTSLIPDGDVPEILQGKPGVRYSFDNSVPEEDWVDGVPPEEPVEEDIDNPPIEETPFDDVPVDKPSLMTTEQKESLGIPTTERVEYIVKEVVEEEDGTVTRAVLMIEDIPPDADNDGLTDAEESRHGTDPQNADTDGDGKTDGSEINSGTDPLSSDSVPAPKTKK